MSLAQLLFQVAVGIPPQDFRPPADFSSDFGPMTPTGFEMVLFSRVDQLTPSAVAGDLAPL